MKTLTPQVERWCQLSPVALIHPFYYFTFLFGLCTMLCSCGAYKVPPKKVSIVVREAHSQAFLANTRITLFKGTQVALILKTDALGYTEFKVSQLANKTRKKVRLEGYRLLASRQFAGQEQPDSVIIPMNSYLSFYSLYLSDPSEKEQEKPPVADMHYHVSMRAHNLFGYKLYDKGEPSLPTHLNWHKYHKKLRVLHKGKWKKPYLGKIDFDSDSPRWARRRERMEILLGHRWLRPKRSAHNNSLQHYTQATHPHIKEGNVMLAFNAISPFEHNLANDGRKRIVSTYLKSGAPLPWLRRIGWKKKSAALTHWENFNAEYQLITSQQQQGNHFRWRFLKDGAELAWDTIPTVANVVEGSHILQHHCFPHALDYDLARRTEKQNQALYEKIRSTGAFASRFQQLDAREENLKSLRFRDQDSLSRREWAAQREAEWESLLLAKMAVVDSAMIMELEQNIDSLKRLSGPPIHMLTVAHLSYNGMMGHAPALDDGRFPANLIARKVYDIRVSDDPLYQSQWKGIFYSVPGINKFGKAVIKGLVEPDAKGRRILVDLKHSDLISRKYFFDSIMLVRGPAGEGIVDTIPPICSHCAVTGLPEPYFSPLNDEYSLLKSPSTTTFYPFGINIYDEEIARIARYNGIIGIPLEQRVLGGYINQKVKWNYRVSRNGSLARRVEKRARRKKQIRRVFHYFFNENDSSLSAALQYTQKEMGVPPEKKYKNDFEKNETIIARTLEDYLSAEPFLQNLFHIIDHTQKEREAAWQHVCIGSDLDGVIDPIDICPTASQYPHFRARLRQFIPLFLKIRKLNDLDNEIKTFDDYFDEEFTLERALNSLFYESLRNFSMKNFTATQIISLNQ